MDIIHTLPFFVRGERKEQDLRLIQACFQSLSQTENSLVVIYNQGCMSEAEIENALSQYNLEYIIIGEGHNVGIPMARQKCFEYIWANYPNVPYASEIHVDMIFPKDWHKPIIEFLEQSNEPMASPCLLTRAGELHPLYRTRVMVQMPEITVNNVLSLLQKISSQYYSQEPQEGFVHPVIHKSNILRQVGGYDLKFLTGKQGYEDDSLLLGYSYYMGTASSWRPKCIPTSWVYHETLAQRTSLGDMNEDMNKNLDGLIQQYGAYGIKELARIHGGSHFESIYRRWN